jgi:Leucine-rich repeat (LRR) protein
MAALEPQRLRQEVTSLVIDTTSQQQSLAISALFPNLEYVEVRGPRVQSIEDLLGSLNLRTLRVATDMLSKRSLAPLPKMKLRQLEIENAQRQDIPFIGSASTVKRLDLANWPNKDLAGLESLSLENLTARRGAIESFRGINCKSLSVVFCLNCRSLVDMSGLKVPAMDVEACKKVNDATFGSVEGLVSLHLRLHHPIDDLSFVEKCKTLEELFISDTPVNATDVGPIVRSPSLKRISIHGQVRDETVQQMSAGNNKLLVTTHNACYYQGKKIDPNDFYNAIDLLPT